jgi:5-methylcytosine-specific restriction endonuclease McrA
MAERTCSIDGCETKHFGRGWCQKHYLRWRNHGDPLRERPPREKPCKVDGCDGIAGKPGTARGWCASHYQRWQKWGDPLGERALVNVGSCAIDGCDKPAKSMGWCVTHYSRYHRKGDPLHRLAGEVVDGKRICPTCGEDKPRTPEFWYPRAGRPDGLDVYCKECVKRRRRQSRNPEYEASYRRRPDRAAKAAEVARERRAADPEIGYRSTRRRRARLAGVPSEPYRRSEIADRDEWRCQLCGDPILPIIRYPHPRSLSIDHIIPLSLGGADTADGVQASHLRCNLRKSNSLSL